MTHPKISVIMPCYKAQDTVRCAIESVRQQSFSDFELLVVDDGSTDGSPAIAAAMVLDDRRIRLIRQRNAGPAAARNRGLAESTGDFIAFLDADDRWVGTLLARHLRLAQQNPLCGVSFGRVRFYDPELRHAGRMSSPPARLSLASVLGEYPVCTTSNLFCRRAAYEEAGGFDTALTHGEDQEWVARILATTDWQVCGIAEELVHYRTSPNGLSADLPKMEAGWAAMLNQVRGYAPEAASRAAAEADALFHRYLARRALRTGQPRSGLSPLCRAWRASPRAMLTRAPARSVLTTLGVALAMVPGNPAQKYLAS